MKYKPRPYQEFAISFVREHPACLLAIDMGLGKTSITATVFTEFLQDMTVEKVLIIAPKTVAEHTWQQELQKWDHTRDLTVSTLLGTAAQREAALRRDAMVYIINVDNVVWLVDYCAKKLGRWPFDMLVLDESSRFKTHSTKRFKALKSIRQYVDRVVLLSGTPMSNSLQDLWAQSYLMDFGKRLGRNITAYRNQFFYLDHSGFNYLPLPGADETIHKALSDISISMSAKDKLDLPEALVVDEEVELPPKAMKTYRELRKTLLLNLDETRVTAPTAATLINKLLQLANGFLYDEEQGTHLVHQAKLDRLTELVEDIGQNVLVFYRFKADHEALKQRFPKAREVREPGALAAWNRGEVSVLLAHPASAGHGLNLQAGGHHIIWYGLPWSLEHYLQANARLHRMGQENRVIIHRLIATKTADIDVAKALSDRTIGLESLLRSIHKEI